MLLGLSVECDLSMSRVTKTQRQTSKSFRLQHSSIHSVITMLLGIWTTIKMVNGQHKVNHSQQGTCQCKSYNHSQQGTCQYKSHMVTRLSPPTMLLVEYVQKLALILIVIVFKSSTNGVTSRQWCRIAWDSFEMVARRIQTTQAVNRSKLFVHNWLNLGSQRAKFGCQR
jgi:hypothetical protein